MVAQLRQQRTRRLGDCPLIAELVIFDAFAAAAQVAQQPRQERLLWGPPQRAAEGRLVPAASLTYARAVTLWRRGRADACAGFGVAGASELSGDRGQAGDAARAAQAVAELGARVWVYEGDDEEDDADAAADNSSLHSKSDSSKNGAVSAEAVQGAGAAFEEPFWFDLVSLSQPFLPVGSIMYWDPNAVARRADRLLRRNADLQLRLAARGRAEVSARLQAAVAHAAALARRRDTMSRGGGAGPDTSDAGGDGHGGGDDDQDGGGAGGAAAAATGSPPTHMSVTDTGVSEHRNVDTLIPSREAAVTTEIGAAQARPASAPAPPGALPSADELRRPLLTRPFGLSPAQFSPACSDEVLLALAAAPAAGVDKGDDDEDDHGPMFDSEVCVDRRFVSSLLRAVPAARWLYSVWARGGDAGPGEESDGRPQRNAVTSSGGRGRGFVSARAFWEEVVHGLVNVALAFVVIEGAKTMAESESDEHS
jgi:hypothetical protein